MDKRKKRGTAKNDGPLAELMRRQAVLRDWVGGVGLGYRSGLYVFGPPGSGKSHIVRYRLDQMGVPYILHKGALTDMGFFDMLEEKPDGLFVLDDLSEIFKKPRGLQLLLAALGREPGQRDVRRSSRRIKYQRQGHEAKIDFTGGIIAISNLDLSATGVLEAVRSRVDVMNYDPTDEQLVAVMRDIASKGWPTTNPQMTPAECREVTAFLTAEIRRRSIRPDLRLQCDKAFPSYLQWRDRNTESHWQDLVRASIEQCLIELTQPLRPVCRVERLEAERQIAVEIAATFQTRPERLAAWQEQTMGRRSERAFYRRLREAGGTDTLTLRQNVKVSDGVVPVRRMLPRQDDQPRPHLRLITGTDGEPSDE